MLPEGFAGHRCGIRTRLLTAPGKTAISVPRAWHHLDDKYDRVGVARCCALISAPRWPPMRMAPGPPRSRPSSEARSAHGELFLGGCGFGEDRLCCREQQWG